MRFININKIAAVVGLGVAIASGAVGASAQSRGQQNKIVKQQVKIEKQTAKLQQERAKRDRLLADQARNTVVRNNVAVSTYRLNNGGRWYNVDNRQADLLRQAVNAGYQQGFAAGQNDHNARRRMSWTGNSLYRSGMFGYNSYVDRGLYQSYFQQGFERGYQDGFNSTHRFGTGQGGGIIGSILNGILQLQRN